MAALPLRQQLNQFLRFRKKRKTDGFTLIELLVVILIAGGIISGLMYLVVELLSVDQRESSRTETQREMQLAMDYIAEELREAVYVYNGACLVGRNTGASTAPGYCPRTQPLVNFLPANLQNAQNIPIIAFWKQQPFPPAIKSLCSTNLAAATTAQIPCTSASSYALVVYYISTENNGNVWDGNARIKRYALNEFKSDGTTGRSQGYVLPDQQQVKFDTWPLSNNGVNQQGNSRPIDTSAVLVDFLDNRLVDGGSPEPACPTGYSISPDRNVFTGGVPAIRSFYACIDNGNATGRNRDVILYIRGNAQGRPGISGRNTFVPTLETRVLVRGVLGKVPRTAAGGATP